MKIAYVILMIWAFVTFWPLVVLLLAGLAVYLAVIFWRTKHLMNGYDSSRQSINNADIIDAVYTEKEVEHDQA